MGKRAFLTIFFVAFLAGACLGAAAYWFFFMSPVPQSGILPSAAYGPIPAEDGEHTIRITRPSLFEAVSSPLAVTGEARGTWFFEATFPVFLKDASGAVIAQGAAHAEGDWMTEQFVPFTATLVFSTPSLSAKEGSVVFKKGNPSGLPQFDKEFSVPVRFE